MSEIGYTSEQKACLAAALEYLEAHRQQATVDINGVQIPLAASIMADVVKDPVATVKLVVGLSNMLQVTMMGLSAASGIPKPIVENAFYTTIREAIFETP